MASNLRTQQSERVRFIAQVLDESALHRVALLYTNGDGEWRLLELTFDAVNKRWVGTIDNVTADLLFIVQAVDEAGNVGTSSVKSRLLTRLPATISINPTSVAEGESVTFRVEDLGPELSPIVSVEWSFGDGFGVVGAAEVTHSYRDSGAFTVNATVSGETGWIAQGTLPIKVENLPPEVEPGPDVSSDANGSVSVPPTTFFDPGALDTHTATVSWGDGSNPQFGKVVQAQVGPPGAATGTEGNASFPPHIYGLDGLYEITICVRDDEGAETCDGLHALVYASDVPQPRQWLPLFFRG